MMTEEQLEIFLKGNATKDDCKRLADYMQNHPEALEQMMPENEWEKYKAQHLNTTIDQAFYKNIHRSINRKKNILKKAVAWSSAVAALLLIAFNVHHFLPLKTTVAVTKIVATQPVEITHKNNTSKAVNFILPDETFVTLSPGSEIKYATDYNNTKRDVLLTGKAIFKVAKNKQKPFTVFCHSIATTALGTRFSVDGNVKNTAVVLYEGKVVVKKISDEKLLTYLLPGDAVAFNSNRNVFERLHGNEMVLQPVDNGAVKDELASKNNKELHKENTTTNTAPANARQQADVYTLFENQSLKVVLDQLAEIYHVEINYPTEISSSTNVYFSVDTSQPIENILRNIAALNNLDLKKDTANKFYFSK